MSTRTVKQNILLSCQMPRRLKAFIDQQSDNAYKECYILNNGTVNVKENTRYNNLQNYSLYHDASLLGFKTNQEIWSWLKETKKDFNSRFKHDYGITLDEYTKQH